MSSFRLIVDADRSSDFVALGQPTILESMHLHVFHSGDTEITGPIRQKVLAVTSAGYTAIFVPDRAWKAVFFDMDSTVIAEESIVELARAAGREAEVHAITEQAMAGLLDFKTSLKQRVGMLRGVSAQVIEDVSKNLSINPGMKEFSQAAEARGVELYLISGGFNPLAKKIAEQLGFKGFRANELAIQDGKLTGELIGAIIDGEAKVEYMLEVCHSRSFALHDVVAVGDGANDLPMLQKAGASIGYHPKAVLFPYLHGVNLHDHRVLVHALL